MGDRGDKTGTPVDRDGECAAAVDDDGDTVTETTAPISEIEQLDFDPLTTLPTAAPSDTVRTLAAVVTAAGLHVVTAVALFYPAITDSRIGTGASQTTEIAVNLVTTAAFDRSDRDNAGVRLRGLVDDTDNRAQSNDVQDQTATDAFADSAPSERGAKSKPKPQPQSAVKPTPQQVQDQVQKTDRAQKAATSDQAVAPGIVLANPDSSPATADLTARQPPAVGAPATEAPATKDRPSANASVPRPSNSAQQVVSLASAPSEQRDAATAAKQAEGADSGGQPDAIGAAALDAKGEVARGFDAEMFRSLTPLRSFLQTANDRRSRRAVGRLKLRLTVGEGGRVTTVQVAETSGDVALDNIAIRDVRSFRFPVPPPNLSLASRTYLLPITYR